MNLIKQLIGPAITLTVVLLTHILSPYISISFALPFVTVVFTAYISGPIPTGLSIIITLISMGILYPPDHTRLIQASLSTVLVGVMVSILKHRAAMSESLNGNVKRLREALDITRKLLIDWNEFSDRGRLKQVRLIEDKLGNLAALVYGWHKIHQEMEETRAETKDDSIRQSSE